MKLNPHPLNRFLIPILFVVLFALVSCTAAAQRLDSSADLVSDSGGITRLEMEQAADRFAGAIGQFFDKKKPEEGVFLAHLPMRNETSEIISTEFFDDVFVRELLQEEIRTVRVETRQAALDEIKFSQSGLTERSLELGYMAVPNYFVESRLLENRFRSGGDLIVEQTISVELIEVETQLAVWTDRVVFRKRAVSQEGVKW